MARGKGGSARLNEKPISLRDARSRGEQKPSPSLVIATQRLTSKNYLEVRKSLFIGIWPIDLDSSFYLSINPPLEGNTKAMPKRVTATR